MSRFGTELAPDNDCGKLNFPFVSQRWLLWKPLGFVSAEQKTFVKYDPHLTRDKLVEKIENKVRVREWDWIAGEWRERKSCPFKNQTRHCWIIYFSHRTVLPLCMAPYFSFILSNLQSATCWFRFQTKEIQPFPFASNLTVRWLVILLSRCP